MAKRATNGFDADELRLLIERVENVEAEIETEKGAYMRRCRSLRDDIKGIYNDAKAAGIPKKALQAHLTLRKLERRKEAVVEKLGESDGESFDMIADALGDLATLPLGMAALNAKADGQKAAKAANDAAVMDEMVPAEDEG